MGQAGNLIVKAKEGHPFGQPSLFLLLVYYNRVFKLRLKCLVILIPEDCGFTKLLFNAKQLVVLGNPVGTAQ